MNTYDYLAIALYFVAVLGAGVWFRRRASRSLEAYFLGGKSLHWSFLAMSGAVSNFDITGTMWMVSVLFVLGMQSWWHHWMWGVAMPAFAVGYMARWVRRSNVMTAAEWMRTRFGSDPGARVARYAYATMAIVFTVAAVGYAFQGIGKFAVVYLPLDGLAARLPWGGEWIGAHQPEILATLVFLVTTLYVVLGGLYSVVVTDVIQTVILTAAGVLIAVVAYTNVSPAVLDEKVPEGFFRLVPSWRLDHLASTDHAEFRLFGFLVISWVLKGLLMNAGGPAQGYDFQRYVATASVRDACKLAASWPLFLVVRWAMVMGITLLALTGALRTEDPEQIMPAILQEYLGEGVRGLVIAGLLAAFMSTFSSTVNAGASFIVRDLWQPIFRPHADEGRLIRHSHVATVALVILGIVVGYQARSIAQIWDWMMMALTAGVIVPNVLRWHWWRLNGWGYACGVLGGMALAGVKLWTPDLPTYVSFPLICLGSLVGSVIGSLLTRPTDGAQLAQFVRSVRPFGWWGPARDPADTAARLPLGESASLAFLNTAVATVTLTALYLGPMYLIGHRHLAAAVCGGLVVVGVVVLRFTWYERLPRE